MASVLRHLVVVVIAVALMASPAGAAHTEPNERAFTIDEEFLKVAEQAPAFGGLYFRNRRLVLLLTDGGESLPAVRRALVEYVGRLGGQGRVLVRPAKYGWAELFYWYECLGHTAWRPGTNMTDIDDKRNWITIGVRNPARHAPPIEADAERCGIPGDALVVKRQAPIRSLDSAPTRKRAKRLALEVTTDENPSSTEESPAVPLPLVGAASLGLFLILVAARERRAARHA